MKFEEIWDITKHHDDEIWKNIKFDEIRQQDINRYQDYKIFLSMIWASPSVHPDLAASMATFWGFAKQS